MWKILDWLEEFEINFAVTCIKTYVINHSVIKDNAISHHHFYQIDSMQEDFEDIILYYVDFNKLLSHEETNS